MNLHNEDSSMRDIPGNYSKGVCQIEGVMSRRFKSYASRSGESGVEIFRCLGSAPLKLCAVRLDSTFSQQQLLENHAMCCIVTGSSASGAIGFLKEYLVLCRNQHMFVRHRQPTFWWRRVPAVGRKLSSISPQSHRSPFSFKLHLKLLTNYP